MTCESCVAEVRASLTKLPTIAGLDLKLKPPIARFKIATDKVSLQEIVLAIRGGGKRFDGKLLVEEDLGLSQKVLDDLDKAISAVPGVRNSGAPDEHGRRVIAFDLTKRTRLADVLGAAHTVGVDLRTPAPNPQ